MHLNFRFLIILCICVVGTLAITEEDEGVKYADKCEGN